MLTIAAIALPAIASSIKAGNESAAASTLRSMTSSEQNFRNMWGAFAAKSADMGDPSGKVASGTAAPLPTASGDIADQALAAGADAGFNKSSYVITRLPAPTALIGNTLSGGYAGVTGYVWSAVPDAAGYLSGRKEFCISNGVLHTVAFNGTPQLNTYANCVADTHTGQ